MAAVTATLEAIENDRMLANVKTVEAYLRQRLREVEQVVAVHADSGFCWELSSLKSGGRSQGIAGTKDHHRHVERSERAAIAAAACV
jgi:4-aminobutyrate aminotransferase-like enzyme